MNQVEARMKLAETADDVPLNSGQLLALVDALRDGARLTPWHPDPGGVLPLSQREHSHRVFLLVCGPPAAIATH